jgi:bidirectional [NiFe] hydrogenase diaphorase subunit
MARPGDSCKELCVMVKETSLCGLGQSAPNPVLSTIHYFLDEYDGAHPQPSLLRRASVTLDQMPVTELVHA